MPEAFRFLSRIPELIEGPAALLTTVRQMLAETHRVTKAGDASRIPADDVRVHVVATILAAVKGRLRAPLEDELAAHLAEIVAEHELMEGEPPELSDMVAALRGSDIETVLGSDRLEDVLSITDESAVALAGSLLAVPVQDVNALLERLSISDADIDTLVAEVRRPPDRQAFGLPDFARVVRRALAAGGDLMEMDDLVKDVVCAMDNETLAGAVARLPFEGLEVEAVAAWVRGRAAITDAPQDMADAEEILRLATAPVASTEKGGDSHTTGLDSADSADARLAGDMTTAGDAPAAPPAAKTRGRPVGSGPAATDATRAAQGALVALCDLSSATEQAVADMLGISRSQLGNYRRGKSVFAASADQVKAMGVELRRYAQAMRMAAEELDMAQEE